MAPPSIPTRLKVVARDDDCRAWLTLTDVTGGVATFQGPAVLEGRRARGGPAWSLGLFVGERLLAEVEVPCDPAQAGIVSPDDAVTVEYTQREHMVWADCKDDADDTPSMRLTITAIRLPADM